jgi:transcriptional regulator with XRE-family HTH domain
MSISASQCRAARALLDLSQDQLADKAHVARATIADFERNARTPMHNNLVSIVSALEAEGVAFISESGEGEGAGVRLRKIELEYTSALKIRDKDVLLSVRYRAQPYRIVIPRRITDDIDPTLSLTADQRIEAVQARLPIFLRAAEKALATGQYAASTEVELDSGMFPVGTF